MEKNNKNSNVIAIVGFILSFFIGLAGLICSIIGLVKSKELKDGKAFSIAGIIISSLRIALTIFIFILGMLVVIDESKDVINDARSDIKEQIEDNINDNKKTVIETKELNGNKVTISYDAGEIQDVFLEINGERRELVKNEYVFSHKMDLYENFVILYLDNDPNDSGLYYAIDYNWNIIDNKYFVDNNYSIKYNSLNVYNNIIQYDAEYVIRACQIDVSLSDNCKLYSCEELKKIGEELPGVIKYSLKYENGIFEKPTIISETKFKDTEMYNYLINSCN